MARRDTSPRPDAPRPLDRNSPMPLWAQLRDELRRRLESGVFDEAFPGELALVEEYAVSRHTVRSALRELRAAGLVVAERGRRPRRAANITQPLGALYSLFTSVEAAGLRQTSIVLARDVRSDEIVADRLGLDASTPLFRLERLRLAAGEPLALELAWLPAAIAGPLLDVDFTHTALYDELASRVGVRIDGGQEFIRAAVPSKTQCGLLGISPATAVLAIDRLGSAGGYPVEWRQTVIRGDRFSLVADFSPRAGYHIQMNSLYQAAYHKIRAALSEH